MSLTFDFNDGNGPVSAHRHPNGGGWVADTASVADTAYVGLDARVSGDAQVYGPNARVFGNARVYGNALVFDNALVYGDAQVFDNARVYGDAQVFDNARVYGNARVKRGNYTVSPISITRSDGHTFTLQSDRSILAGCRDMTPEEADAHWGNPEHRKHAESVAIVNALRAIDAAIKGTKND